jgi:membrane protein
MTDISMDELTPKQALSGVARMRASIRWLLAELQWVARMFLSSGDRFYWDNGFSKAASLAYSSLISLVPLTALCFGIFGAFTEQNEQVQRFLFQQFVPNIDEMPQLLSYVQAFSATMRSLNAVVISTLVVTSLLLLASIEYALNQVWQVYESRPLTDRIAIFCAIIVLVPFFAVSGWYTTTIHPFVNTSELVFLVPFYKFYQDSLPFLIDFLAFVALYYFVPKAPVMIASASFGAFVSATLFGIAKYYFAMYIQEFSSYQSVYGSIAIVPIFLFWLYISWTIVLFGAEVSYQAQHLPRVGRLWKRSLMTVGDGAMLLAMQALVLVVRAFRAGHKLPNEIEVAEQLGCSSVVLKPSLDALEQAGIIMRGDGRDMPLLLMRSPETISVAEVRDAVFKKRHSMFLGTEMRRMYDCFSEQRSPASVTLAELVRD